MIQADRDTGPRMQPEIEIPVAARQSSLLEFRRLGNLAGDQRAAERRFAAKQTADRGQNIRRDIRIRPDTKGRRNSARWILIVNRYVCSESKHGVGTDAPTVE